MGKPTGFLEYERRVSEEIAPLERIKNFNEFHIPLPLEKQQLQGARCMACGVPFCQYGKMINGMASGCPLNRKLGTVLQPSDENTLFSRIYFQSVPGTL